MEHFLAFDLGAESGRAMLGRLRAGVLDLTEVYRFANEPVREHASLHWDLLRLWLEMQRAVQRVSAAGTRLESVGVDTWGCDYGLLDEAGQLLGNPFHYRDSRTDGVMDTVFARVPRARIYDVTGTQFLPFNTLYQLFAACQTTPRVIDAAAQFGTIPDILNYWPTGVLRAEFSSATTTQMVDARARAWATELLCELDIPTRILPPLVEPGTILGRLRGSLSRALAGTPVVAPACHDTGSAVASVAAFGSRAFLSSGTWSLLGLEIARPIITSPAHDANFTNEGGVGGTTQALEEHQRHVAAAVLPSCLGRQRRVIRLRRADGRRQRRAPRLPVAFQSRRSRRSCIRGDMPAAIGEFCQRTEQPAPAAPAEFARAILESLAFRYRMVLESLQELTGTVITEIQIVGGGSRNRLLNQFTADATGRTCLRRPCRSHRRSATSPCRCSRPAPCSSLAEARGIIAHSFPVERFEPVAADRWNAHYRRFQHYVERTCV